MAISALHQELANLSQANPAGYIETPSFARLTVGRLDATATLLKGKEIPAGSGVLSAVLRDLHWSSQPRISLTPPRNPAFPDREVDVIIPSTFDITVEIFISGDTSKVISQVVMSITDARIHLRAESNVLILEGADFTAVRHINRTQNAGALLTAAGIDPLEAARIEGHVGYGVVSQAVTAALAQRSEIPLATVFPAVDFGKSIKLAILVAGGALGIIPTEKVSIVSSARCVCTEGPDFEVSKSTITNTAPPDPKPNDQIGKVTIGGPIPDNKDPLRDFGPRSSGTGMAGLYIPKAFAEALTVEVMPAPKIVASDHGTIGFRAEASVGFKNFRVSFDVAAGGILLDIDLDISVSAYCDMELFKGLRVPIGWAIVAPAQGSKARVQLGFYPSIDSSGVVKLRTTLKKADMGSYVAVVIGIGTALKFLGVTAWIGFLIDVVLAALLAHGIPIALKKEISKYLGSKEWKLLDSVPVIDPAITWYPKATYDVGPSSLLASFDVKG